MNFLEELHWRGLVKETSSNDELKSLLSNPSSIYIGFDPSAQSMHIGNFVQISLLMRFQQAGHRVIALVGGATGMIGDPSGKSKERNLLDERSLDKNTQGIKKQLERFIDLSNPSRGLLVNNYDWLGSMSYLHFLRDYGKYFPVNYMLAKDVVSSRMEAGISYTEFSYMILQAVDFLTLFNEQQCTIQIGGSDQWGNLTAGLELIRKVKGSEAKAAVMTTPLITTSDGKKFGKSEEGALFLDASLTSPYKLYQYFVNVPDADAINYVKIFTFLTPDDIISLEKIHHASPGSRIGQKKLAEEITRLIHGEQGLQEALQITEAFFSGAIQTLTEKQIQSSLGSIAKPLAFDMPIEDVLVVIGAASSKREAKEFITNKSITVNGNVIDQIATLITKTDALFHRYTIIRRGKKNYYLIEHTTNIPIN
jgi:tyrosyl-tRNA synthetase